MSSTVLVWPAKERIPACRVMTGQTSGSDDGTAVFSSAAEDARVWVSAAALKALLRNTRRFTPRWSCLCGERGSSRPIFTPPFRSGTCVDSAPLVCSLARKRASYTPVQWPEPRGGADASEPSEEEPPVGCEPVRATRGVSMDLPPQANKTARELIERKPHGVIAVSPDETVLQALKILAEKDIGTVLVMRGESMVGILSERDCARKVDLKGRAAANTRVRDIMTEQVVVARPATTIVQCMALMKERRIRHLPVVDGTKVLGVLSSRDVLEEIIAEEKGVLEDLQHEMIFYGGNTGGTY